MMPRRAVVVVAGILAMAGHAALAVTGPMTVDPLEPISEPKPISESKPNGAPPGPPAGATTDLAKPTVRATPEPAWRGNPLWGIPLSRLTASRQKPLFSPTRQPPAVVVAKPPPASPAPPPRPVEPETPQLSLLGTVAGGEKIGLFIDATTKAVLSLKAGEIHRGWTLRDVTPRQAELARGLDTAVLALPSPDLKAAAQAAHPVSPAASAAATGAPPVPKGPGPIGLAKPSFDPPPQAVNPFQNAPRGAMR